MVRAQPVATARSAPHPLAAAAARASKKEAAAYGERLACADVAQRVRERTLLSQALHLLWLCLLHVHVHAHVHAHVDMLTCACCMCMCMCMCTCM